MSFRYDLYVERDSWLHRLDPRVKLLAVLLGMVAILSYQNLLVILLVLATAHLLILSSRVPWRHIEWVWQRMLPINLLLPMLFLVFYPEGVPLLAVGPLRVTFLAPLRGLVLALRLDAIAFIVFAWLFTTDQARIVRSLVRLGMPYEIALVLAISLRYIPTFYGLFTAISEAQQARALDLSSGSLVQRLRRYMPILVAMMITAVRAAERLGQALEARGFGARGVKRTCLREIRFRPSDYFVLAIIVVGFVVALLARFAFDFGVGLLSPLP